MSDTVSINISDYLTEEDKVEIARQAFREQCLADFKKDGERIFSNSASDTVHKLVDEHFDGKTAEKIKEKTLSVINELSSFTVFRAPDYYSGKSAGYEILCEEMQKLRPKVAERLLTIINEMSETDLKVLLEEEAIALLDSKLFGKKAAA